MSRLLRVLQPARYVEFTQLFHEHADLPHLVVTFLAILELSREGLIDVVQAGAFAPIHVQLKSAVADSSLEAEAANG
jgi:segregation and condensation protein A